MKRFYFSPILGNGDIDAPPSDTTGEFRTAAADYAVSAVTAMPQQDPATGALLGTWALVMVVAEDHAQLLADPRLQPLPDVSLDIKAAAIGDSARTSMIALINSKGLPSSIVTNADAFRDIVTAIGVHLNPAFDLGVFDAA